ncbi:MAG: hypothetical protein TRG1_3189 [Flavobacteriaceae bacterium FS1-H7996/R]|nr:MAG: hypothetical protein TRG1_3189 [Flavobacteriaceae bacterium FS1-H7996/R]
MKIKFSNPEPTTQQPSPITHQPTTNNTTHPFLNSRNVV